MSIRFYQLAVICFWLSTVTWLVSTKLVPALRRGDPPNHHAVSVARCVGGSPVIWDMKWNFYPVGWAANKVIRNDQGQIELLSRLQFTDWPKNNSAISSWLLKQLADWGDNEIDGFQMQLTNRSILDGNHQLQQLNSAITLGRGGPIASVPWMQIQGKVVKDKLLLSFQLGDRHLGDRAIPIRSHSLISSEISPHGFMPRLRIHQEWSTYQISPLRPPTSPQLPIVAKVERYEPMIWDNKIIETFLVIYRKDEGSGSRSADDHLGRLWVRPDNGMVLKQEVVLLGSRFTLVRRTAEAAGQLATELDENWDAQSSNSDSEAGSPHTPRGTTEP